MEDKKKLIIGIVILALVFVLNYLIFSVKLNHMKEENLKLLSLHAETIQGRNLQSLTDQMTTFKDEVLHPKIGVPEKIITLFEVVDKTSVDDPDLKRFETALTDLSDKEMIEVFAGISWDTEDGRKLAEYLIGKEALTKNDLEFFKQKLPSDLSDIKGLPDMMNVKKCCGDPVFYKCFRPCICILKCCCIRCGCWPVCGICEICKPCFSCRCCCGCCTDCDGGCDCADSTSCCCGCGCCNDFTIAYLTSKINQLETKINDHMAANGNPHAVVSTQITDFDTAISNNSDVAANTAHRASDGKDHSDVVLNNTHREIVSGNPHGVAKSNVGLGNVPDTDFTADVNANTDHRNLTSGNPHQVVKSDILTTGNLIVNADVDTGANIDESKLNITTASHSHANKAELDLFQSGDRTTIMNHTNNTDNPHSVTKAQVGLGNVPDMDFTSDVSANTTHRTSTTGNPHSVTKTDVGLGNVADTDFTADVGANTAHRNLNSGNPHGVTKSDVGLSNVPNTDFSSDVNANTAHRNINSGNPHNVTKSDVLTGDLIVDTDISSGANIDASKLNLIPVTESPVHPTGNGLYINASSQLYIKDGTVYYKVQSEGLPSNPD